MRGCDLFGAAVTKRKVVDESGNGREQRADDPAHHCVKRNTLPKDILGTRMIDQVADQRENPQADREHDQHRMDRVLANACRTAHIHPGQKRPSASMRMRIMRMRPIVPDG